jgi:two-component system KDP operon response regulator KdpE
MTTEEASVLVVDDEARYTRVLKATLEGASYRVLTVSSGEEALTVAGQSVFDLILLDVRMPGLDGLETCRRLRQFSLAPVIMLTALAEEDDRIRGLDAGADDYITKPFSAGELLARVRAVLRRAAWDDAAGAAATPAAVQVGDLRLDLTTRTASVAGRDVRLTATEFRVLRELARHPGRIFTPEQLLAGTWGAGYEGETGLVRQAIHRLRAKIEADPVEPQILRSQPGVGYYLAA